MSTNRVALVERNLDELLASAQPSAHRLADDEPVADGRSLTARKAREIFEDQYLSRTLDVVARELKKENKILRDMLKQLDFPDCGCYEGGPMTCRFCEEEEVYTTRNGTSGGHKEDCRLNNVLKGDDPQ